MVAVAQLVEHWIVIPGVAGSSPVGHPSYRQGTTFPRAEHSDSALETSVTV
jgi:hypothetical protein